MVAYVPPKQAGKYKAVASGAITNGKPVIVNSTGTVSQISATASAAAFGSEATYESASSSYNAVAFDSSNNKIVIAYTDGGATTGNAVVATVDPSDNSITFGTPVVFNNAATSYIDIVFDSNSNKVVIVYTDGGNSSYGTAIVGTVSGTSISFGSEAVFESASTNTVTATFDSNSNKVVVCYKDNGNSFYGTSIVGTVSSTSISFGSAVVFESANSPHISPTFDSNSNKVVIAYSDAGDSTKGKAIVGTVSGTGISYGTAAEFESGNTVKNSAVFDSNSNKVVISYCDSGDSNKGKAVVGTVSGTSISFGSIVEFNAGETDDYISSTFDSNSNTVITIYNDRSNSDYGTINIGTVSGTDISYGGETVFNAGGTNYIGSSFDTNVNRVVIAYQDAGNSSYGTAIVHKGESTNLTSENYIGIASGGTYVDTAEATIDVVGTVNKDQSGLTAGQTYFVQTDGTLGTTADDPSVVAGTAISATELIVKG